MELVHSNRDSFFDCGSLCAFDADAEAICAGGSRFDIATFCHNMDEGLTDYKRYVDAIGHILERELDLDDDGQDDVSESSKKTILQLLQHRLNRAETATSQIPPYIQKMLSAQMDGMTDPMHCSYAALANHAYLKSIFVKDSPKGPTPNATNLLRLFRTCTPLTFLMPETLAIDDAFRAWLLENVMMLSDVPLPDDVRLVFKWNKYDPMWHSLSKLLAHQDSFAEQHWRLQRGNMCSIKLSKLNGDEPAPRKSLEPDQLTRSLLVVLGYYHIYSPSQISPDIVQLTMLFYGDGERMQWTIRGEDLARLIGHDDSDDDESESENGGLVSEPHTVVIKDLSLDFVLRITCPSTSRSSQMIVTLCPWDGSRDDSSDENDEDSGSAHMHMRIQTVLRCVELQKEWRRMVTMKSSSDGVDYDSSMLSEIKQAGLNELTFTCEITVLSVWSQVRKIAQCYHSGHTMQRRSEFTRQLCSDTAPANATDDSTLWYSPFFDGRTWCLQFKENHDEFSIVLKLLAMPFCVSMLDTRVHFSVRRRSTGTELVYEDVYLFDVEYCSESDHDTFGKDWKKTKLFGGSLFSGEKKSQFSLSDIVVTVRTEILRVRDEKQNDIFSMNWPLFGIVTDELELFDNKTFVYNEKNSPTKSGFFSNQFMFGMLRAKIEALEVALAAREAQVKRDFAAGDEASARQVEAWLERVGMSQYWELLRDEGFDSMDMIKQVNDVADLEYVGVRRKGHQLKLINEINRLKQEE